MEMMPNVTDQIESFDSLSLCVKLSGDDPSVCGGEWKINEFHPACTDKEVVISHWCSNSCRMIDREAVK